MKEHKLIIEQLQTASTIKKGETHERQVYRVKYDHVTDPVVTPLGTPITFTLTNTYTKKTVTINGSVDFVGAETLTSFAPDSTLPTGNYTIQAHIDNRLAVGDIDQTMAVIDSISEGVL